MKEKLQAYFAVVIIMSLIFGVPATGDSIKSSIEVIVNQVNLQINGKTIGQAGENFVLDNGSEVPLSIVYKGTTYLPVRKLTTMMDWNVTWNGDTKTVGLNSQDYELDEVDRPIEDEEAVNQPEPLEDGEALNPEVIDFTYELDEEGNMSIPIDLIPEPGAWNLVGVNVYQYENYYYENASSITQETYDMSINEVSKEESNNDDYTHKITLEGTYDYEVTVYNGTFTEYVDSEIEWTFPNSSYEPNESVMLILSSKINQFEPLSDDCWKNGIIFGGLSVWSHIGSEHSGWVWSNDANMMNDEKDTTASATISDGEVTTPEETILVVGTMGTGTDGMIKTIELRCKMIASHDIIVKFMYEYVE